MLNIFDFEKAKIKQGIKRAGKMYEFSRQNKNEFGEPTGDPSKIQIAGIFSETTGHIVLSGNEAGATISSKPSSSILISADDELKVASGDYTEINSKRYNVTAIINVNNLNLAFKIDLELVGNGNATV